MKSCYPSNQLLSYNTLTIVRLLYHRGHYQTKKAHSEWKTMSENMMNLMGRDRKPYKILDEKHSSRTTVISEAML